MRARIASAVMFHYRDRVCFSVGILNRYFSRITSVSVH